MKMLGDDHPITPELPEETLEAFIIPDPVPVTDTT